MENFENFLIKEIDAEIEPKLYLGPDAVKYTKRSFEYIMAILFDGGNHIEIIDSLATAGLIDNQCDFEKKECKYFGESIFVKIPLDAFKGYVLTNHIWDSEKGVEIRRGQYIIRHPDGKIDIMYKKAFNNLYRKIILDA